MSHPRAGQPGRAAAPTAAEIALTAVTAASVAGLARLFSDGAFLAPLLVVALVAHGLAIVLRRMGVGPSVASALAGLGVLVTVAWVVEPHTLTFGLPLGHTWHAIRADLASAADQFGLVRAPTRTTRGFVLACAVGTWASALAADTFAFRARARFEALVPSFVLFLFGAVLGVEQFRLVSAGLYLAAVLAFAVLGDPARGTGRAWFAGRSGAGDRAVVTSGLAMSLIGVVAALIVGPRLPGAHAVGFVSINGDSNKGSGSRVTVSPLVDIRARLVDQSGTELFTVRASVDAYWRLTSLERFDGTIWSSVGSYEPARGRLPTGVPARAGDQTVVQQFDVGALSSIWLPAAYRPQRLDGVNGVRFDSDSSSLLTDAPTADRLRYSVASTLTHLTADDLATATPRLSSDQNRRYLDLPDDFPSTAKAAAERAATADPVTCQRLTCSTAESSSGRLTPYHQARALQDWFRTDFTYDLNVAPGHGDPAIERFLSERRGYCEQFAGTFAAMARFLGLPSRVAVGFTPGTLGADGRYHVSGREAHAWPEVYLAPTGWVAFEPTPGRAIPRSEAYTGLESASAVPAAGAADAPAASTPVPVAPATAARATTTAPRDESAIGPTNTQRHSGWRRSTALSVSLLAAVSYLVGVPLAHRLRRSRRRSRATTPTARVLLAWSEAEEDLARAGLGRRPAETATEYAARARSASMAPAGPALVELAGQMSSAAYSPRGADEPGAARAEAAAATVRTAVRHDVGPVGRTMWSLDPRPFVRALSPRA